MVDEIVRRPVDAFRPEGIYFFGLDLWHPGEPVEPPLEEVREAIALARDVYDAFLTRLPAEVRP